MQSVLDGRILELKRYRKKDVQRYRIASLALAPAGSVVTVPTLEGPVEIISGPDICVMVGPCRDVYPLSQACFQERYQIIPGDAVEMKPFLEQLGWGNAQAQCCKLRKPSRIFAAPVDRPFQVLVREHGAVIRGEAGDYYAVPEDAPDAPYIIQAHIMAQTYEPDE